MLKYVVVAAVLTTFVTPVLAAEYYVGQNPTTKTCKIFETKPDAETKAWSWVMLGTEAYATEEEARAARKAAAECKKPDAAN